MSSGLPKFTRDGLEARVLRNSCVFAMAERGELFPPVEEVEVRSREGYWITLTLQIPESSGFRDSQFSWLGGELQDPDSELRPVALDSFFMVVGPTETKLIWAPTLNVSELLSSRNN
ncbi:uncharacterized protein LOC144513439 [Sander vitreus]